MNPCNVNILQCRMCSVVYPTDHSGVELLLTAFYIAVTGRTYQYGSPGKWVEAEVSEDNHC